MIREIEKIIKRQDGSKVKILVEITASRWLGTEYVVSVFTCKKGKRTWIHATDKDDYVYRGLDMSNRLEQEADDRLRVVSDAEIIKVKTALWNSINPNNNT